MEHEARRIPSLSKLGKLANSKKFEKLEEVWLEAVGSEEHPTRDLLAIVGQVSRLGAPDRAEGLLSVVLSTGEERHGQARALETARLAAAQMPASGAVRTDLRRLYRAVHPDYPDLDALLDRLFALEEDLPRAVALIDAYLALAPGHYAFDPSFLVPGIVERIDSERAILTVRYDNRRQEYGPATLSKVMPLPDDHFVATSIYRPERLRELAERDPVALVMNALSTGGEDRLSYRDLKTALTKLLGESGWQSWWKRARALLKRAPLVGLSGGSQPTLKLLRQERQYEEVVRREFAAQKTPHGRLLKALAYLQETDPASSSSLPADEQLLVFLGNSAAKMAVESVAADPALALSCLAIHATVAARGVSVAASNPQAVAKVLARLGDPGQLALQPSETLLVHTLEFLRQALPERWPDVWAAVLPRAGRRLCDVLARSLLEAGEGARLEATLGQILDYPSGSPDAVCWLWRTWLGSGLGKRLQAFESLTNERLVLALLSLADSIGKLCLVSGDEDHRQVLDMVYASLMLQAGQPLRELFASLGREEARRYKERVEKNHGLALGGAGRVLAFLRAAHPDLFIEESRPWEEDVIWTTDRGLERRRQQLDRIIKEDIPAVAKQIGEAAAFGDLSENAEFTAALEKRDQLTSRAAAMEEDLKRAQVITREMATSGFVNVGCRVRARDLGEDAEETYTFLGPWDTDTENHVLNYDAPLARAFMGKKVGQEVVFGEGADERRWEILAIEPAI
jgi:transcription elongation factor GreA